MAVDALDTNLLPGSKRKPAADDKNDLSQGRLTSRRKRILKVAAYVIFFLWALVLFTLLKIPDSVVANFLLNSLNQNTPYQWQAEKIVVGFFPAPHLRMEKLGLEPKIPGAGVPLFLDEVRIYPNPFSLIPIGGGPAFGGSFKAEAYKAVIHGSFSTGTNMSLRVETDSADLGRLTPLVQSGVDLKGNVTSLFFQIYLPGQRASQADGEVRLKAKNVLFDPSSLSLPMALPILNLGDVEVQGTLTKGQLKFEKFRVGGAGKDLDLQIPNGTVTLSDVSQNTRYDLHLLLKPSGAIEKAVPGMSSLLATWSTPKPDGYFAMKLQGSLAAPAFPTKE